MQLVTFPIFLPVSFLQLITNTGMSPIVSLPRKQKRLPEGPNWNKMHKKILNSTKINSQNLKFRWTLYVLLDINWKLVAPFYNIQISYTQLGRGHWHQYFHHHRGHFIFNSLPSLFLAQYLSAMTSYSQAQFTQDAEHLATGTMQTMEHTAVNGTVHTTHKQHQRIPRPVWTGTQSSRALVKYFW